MMKLIKNKEDSFCYPKVNIKNNECPWCLSKNIRDGQCFDCGKKIDKIYYKERIIKISNSHTIRMKFNLSNEQKKASLFFLDHYKKRNNAFLYAVCGSGKTEIMYESIKECLNDGLKPLIAIPRKEIVQELYSRLKNVFINTHISFIDGTHHDDSGQLLISTVNQLINYENEFDLIVLDEADAYPYSDSPFLHRLIQKGLKKDGVLFMMSATKKERINYDTFTLKRRYHNHDLSMPIFINIEDKEIAKSSVFHNIIKGNRKFIIYVPSIEYGRKLSNTLNALMISSKSDNPDKIINRFKSGDDKILISTTILERGITINDLDVIVFEADNPVFTHQTIIQICGRVGRSFEDPTGNIYIFYRKNRIKFYLVKKYIRRMNS